MSRSLDARIARLEAPRGDPACGTARIYAMLRACSLVLSRLDGDPMPTAAALWAMAQAEACSGRPPDYTAALQAAWDQHHEP
jgi:hypothetical protein